MSDGIETKELSDSLKDLLFQTEKIQEQLEEAEDWQWTDWFSGGEALAVEKRQFLEQVNRDIEELKRSINHLERQINDAELESDLSEDFKTLEIDLDAFYGGLVSDQLEHELDRVSDQLEEIHDELENLYEEVTERLWDMIEDLDVSEWE